MSDKPHEDQDNLLENLGYEKSDFNLENAPRGAVLFFVALGAVAVVVWLTMRILEVSQGRMPSAKGEVRRRIPEPPNPLLQSNATVLVDIAKLRLAEDRQTETYGWVDANKRIAHIPVSEAMNDVLAKGVAASPTPGPSTEAP